MKFELKIKSAIISIDGNAELDAYATDGTGTVRDPYILENYLINASGLGAGISIKNTNAYYILRNCIITNADRYYAGIMLSNVTNAIITNNTVYNSSGGILLYDSCHNILANNTANHNSGGICLDHSSNNVLIYNTINYNERGIQIRYSSKNIFAHNIANNNAKDGISFFYSTNNQIYENQFQGNGIRLIGQSISHFIQEITPDNMINDRPIYYYKHQNGITVSRDAAQVILVNCSFMSILNCNLSKGIIGISLLFSHHNTLSHNTANFNEEKDDECGIYLYQSNNNTLTHNTANHNGEYGIHLKQSNNNTLINNIANHNDQNGLYLYQSSYNVITNNILNQNGLSGFYLSYSSNNRIRNNDFHSNGILLRGWNMSDFIQEITPDNMIDDRPIYYYKHQKEITIPADAAQVILVNCSLMKILNCNLSTGTIGISLFFSHHNTISHNTVNQNSLYGIYMYQSNYNTLSNNEANHNSRGIYLEDSTTNRLTHNTASHNGIGIYIFNFNNVFLYYHLGPVIDTSSPISGNHTISQNIVNYNNYYGIILMHTNSNRLFHNTINHNRHGICLKNSDDNTISFNTAIKNDYGIYLWCSYKNKIIWNTLHSNNYCIEEICCWSNEIENNYCLKGPNDETSQIPGFTCSLIISGLILIIFLRIIFKQKRYLTHTN
ncbi:MAG: right-handed parallel beta-helix repeat-containing protein [Candidatus Helarchaeota archaeon]|nr:right-handed parallel beta-helix repeat-containing protein [Candidatus Helarchaeota archaeon]